MEPLQTYFVGQMVTLRGWFLGGQTIGSIIKRQTRLEVQDDLGLDLTPAAPIFVEGAGALGGDLVTSVAAHPSAGVVTLADPALTDANRRLVGTPTDPTAVTVKIKEPDATETTIGVSSPAPGRWEATFTPALDGDHFWEMDGSGAAIAAAWRKFVVLPARVP